MRQAIMAAAASTVAMGAPAAAEEVRVTIQRPGSQASQVGLADWFTGTVRVDQPFRGTGQRGSRARPSRSSPARARPGTRIRSARPCWSCQASAGSSRRGQPFRRSCRATSSGSLRA